ncbi:hypothetical protein O6H91_20G060900 [Diphasiastrum complanatum]|uniref:Uncharacterized protein n=1 Tax=Diphasiastrum complanatum TaxID=34168 RepID=A0ACC2AQX5_DIPCM|nr:hypothetical protein O6H91_20G060900 [Diphasiastrum complanatum]
MCSNFAVLIPSIASLKRSILLESADDAVAQQRRINSHRNALKIYVYFLFSIFTAEEVDLESHGDKRSHPFNKTKGSRNKHMLQKWNWDQLRNRIVCLIGASLEAELQQLYGMAQPEENLLAFYAKCGLKMLGNSALLKEKETKDSICKIISACTSKYGYIEQLTPSIIDFLHKSSCEHLPMHLAEIVAFAEQKYQDNRLAVALLREIGGTNPKDYAKVTSIAENTGLFLVELADRLPKLMVTNLSILMPHFGGESYKIRNALVMVMGKLIAKAFKDPDGNSTSETVRLRNKQAMIDVLLERARDASAYTRNRVLQTWAYLCEEHAVSIGLWNQVADLAAGRLADKAALVRKSALQLLGTLLQYNPFGPQLRTGAFEATLDKYKQQLQIMSPSATVGGDQQMEPTELTHPVSEPAGDKCSTGLDGADVDNEHGVDNEDSGPSQVPIQEELYSSDVGGLEQTRALVASLEAGLHFAKRIASAIPVLAQLLASSIVTDVEHTIHFLICCRQFDIDGSEACLQKIFPLVFSSEKSIYEAVESAFRTIYIKKNPQETAASLLALTLDATVGDLAAIEMLVSNLMRSRDISSATISALWDMFTFNVNGVTSQQSRGALSVLCMAAKSSPQVLSSHLQNVLDIGFGRWAKEDLLLARTACVALQRLSDDDKVLLQSSDKVFTVLFSLITGPGLPERSWYATAEQAVNTVYALHPTPEVFSEMLLVKFSEIVFAKGVKVLEAHDATSGLSTAIGEEFGQPHVDLTAVPAIALSRFLFTVGHVALKHLVYLENCVRKIRKLRGDKEKFTAEMQSAVLAGDSQENNDSCSEENIGAELGLAASDEAKLDMLAEKAEKEIMSCGENTKFLIGAIAPIVTKICRNSGLLQQFPQLRSSAMLCLCKLMTIDASYCDENLQLLFTVAQNCPEDSVRSNCIISLGDLAFRFPNLLEPWTDHIYGRLRDQSPAVRKNAVLVISHLILNDMMKVKGHISEMALQLQDKDSSISDLVKLFFSELAKKGNDPIYNLLPDMLSRLSGMKCLEKDSFCMVMQFLIGFIKKDKQMEGLVEKLCNRFLGSSDTQQWQAIAYCLSQLTYGEKAMKKLSDQFKNYEHALVDEKVVDYLKAIAIKAKKLAKPEFRLAVEEFEQKVMNHHREKKEQELALHNAHAHQQGLSAQIGKPNENVSEGRQESNVSYDEALNGSENLAAEVATHRQQEENMVPVLPAKHDEPGSEQRDAEPVKDEEHSEVENYSTVSRLSGDSSQMPNRDAGENEQWKIVHGENSCQAVRSKVTKSHVKTEKNMWAPSIEASRSQDNQDVLSSLDAETNVVADEDERSCLMEVESLQNEHSSAETINKSQTIEAISCGDKTYQPEALKPHIKMPKTTNGFSRNSDSNGFLSPSVKQVQRSGKAHIPKAKTQQSLSECLEDGNPHPCKASIKKQGNRRRKEFVNAVYTEENDSHDVGLPTLEPFVKPSVTKSAKRLTRKGQTISSPERTPLGQIT